MIGIIDYGVGNLFSLKSSFREIGAEAFVSSDPEALVKAEKLVLPGVGAFGDAVEKLRSCGLDKLVIDQARGGKPLLGICLGMQMLFDDSFEYGYHKGLGLLRGSVVSMEETLPQGIKIPHIGWNSLQKVNNDSRILSNVQNGRHVYFVHSFHVIGCQDSLAATTEYGGNITAAVEKDNIFGCQFHPEKSGQVGLGILRSFTEKRD